MVETKRTIVLHDGTRVDLPLAKGQQIWAVQLKIECVSEHTGSATFGSHHGNRTTVVHVTREPLEACGLLPETRKDKPQKADEPETVEDLVLRLLHHVGVYPTE